VGDVRAGIRDIPPRLGENTLVIVTVQQGVLRLFSRRVLATAPRRDSVCLQTRLLSREKAFISTNIPLAFRRPRKYHLTCDSTTISLLVFSFASLLLGTLACCGTKSAPAAALLDPGSGRVTRLAAIAAAIAEAVAEDELSPAWSASSLGAAPSLFDGAGLAGRGCAGLKTGAEADILDAFGGFGGGEGSGLEMRRLGGVPDRADMLTTDWNRQ
jgi:hypothetical protein